MVAFELGKGTQHLTDENCRRGLFEAILECARDAGGGSHKGIKAEMLKLMNDPDRFDRFNDRDKAAIFEIARGLSLFAKVRLRALQEAIRRRGIPYREGR